MGIGPSLVIQGAIVGSVVLSLFGFFATAGISVPPPAHAEALSPEISEQASSVAEVQPQAINELPATTSCNVSSQFPGEILQWCDLISSYSAQFGLQADLIAALIWQESAGNPSAYSHSGAVGLMQVMPRDGLASGFICKNGPCFANRPLSSELYDPEFNVKYGTRMLAGLLNKSGDIREALKNYGPMDVGYSYADKVLSIYERNRQ
jgi:hypothetical protein